MKENIHFSFLSSIFTIKHPSKIEIEEEKIKVESPDFKFFILPNGIKHFSIEKHEIFSMGFSFSASILIFILSVVVSLFPFNLIFNFPRQEIFVVYGMIAFILGFFGGKYIYETIIKPKKKLEEFNLSIEFIVKGIFVIMSIILFFFSFLEVGIRGLIYGFLFAVSTLLFLASLSVRFKIIDKKGLSHSFPFLVWQLGTVKRIFQVNSAEFFAPPIIKNSESHNYNDQNRQLPHTHNNDQNNKGLLFGLLITALIFTFSGYSIPLVPNDSSTSFFNIIKEGLDSSNAQSIVFLLVLPFISMAILMTLTFIKDVRLLKNIFSGISLIALFGLTFFPFHYMNISGRLSARQVARASEELTFGIARVLLFVAVICIIVYWIKNYKKNTI